MTNNGSQTENKKLRNTNLTKNWRWTHMLRKGK